MGSINIFQASVRFPLTSAFNKSQQHQNRFLGSRYMNQGCQVRSKNATTSVLCSPLHVRSFGFRLFSLRSSAIDHSAAAHLYKYQPLLHFSSQTQIQFRRKTVLQLFILFPSRNFVTFWSMDNLPSS